MITNEALNLFLLTLNISSLTAPQSGPIDPFSSFPLDLFNIITSEKQKNNIIISPFSIQSALTLLYMGAEGNTAEEFRNVLQYNSSNKTETAESFLRIQNSTLASSNELVQMQTANRIYTRFDLVPKFNEIALKYFQAEAEKVNFKQREQTAQKINNWVEDNTNNKITNLISPNSIDDDTTAILINAIYFKAQWADQFSERLTKKSNFYVGGRKSVSVDTMFGEITCKYAVLNELDATAIELKYENTDIVMDIILPSNLYGLNNLEQRLSVLDLDMLFKDIVEQEVNVGLPKFKIEFETNLISALEKIGMQTSFRYGGNFTGIFNTKGRVKVSDVIHKAFIEVNELGSEAAASTYSKLVFLSAFSQATETFTADHPFMFVIRNPSAVYFVGHVKHFDN